MSNQYCENCGCRVYRNGCVNCNEAHYIDEQYADLGMETPESILEEMKEKPLPSKHDKKE